MIQFTFDSGNNTLHCNFEGRMDSTASTEIDKEVQKKLCEIVSSGAKPAVVFNMAKVDYIASAFIRICLQTAKNAGAENFSVKNTTPFVMKIFKMAGLDRELNVS